MHSLLLPLILLTKLVTCLLLSGILLAFIAFWVIIDFNLFQLPVVLQQMVHAGGDMFPGHPSENHVYDFFEEKYIENFIWEKVYVMDFIFARNLQFAMWNE